MFLRGHRLTIITTFGLLLIKLFIATVLSKEMIYTFYLYKEIVWAENCSAYWKQARLLPTLATGTCWPEGPASHSPFPLSSPPLPSPLCLYLPLSSLPLEVRPLKSSSGEWGSAVSSPSGVLGKAPAEIELALKSYI